MGFRLFFWSYFLGWGSILSSITFFCGPFFSRRFIFCAAELQGSIKTLIRRFYECVFESTRVGKCGKCDTYLASPLSVQVVVFFSAAVSAWSNRLVRFVCFWPNLLRRFFDSASHFCPLFMICPYSLCRTFLGGRVTFCTSSIFMTNRLFFAVFFVP